MRVISGKYKGRKLLGFDIDGTRPTMDRVKESMFAMIQTKVKNSLVLDLFAGSGALGIEALSNGANECYFVDNNDIAIKTIKSNIKNLDIIEKYQIIMTSYKDALQKFNKDEIRFDIIILDPPYKYNMEDILSDIYSYNLLNDAGIIVCEFENPFNEERFFKKIKEKSFKNKRIVIYEKN